MSLADTVGAVVAPTLAPLGVELVDVEHKGTVVRVVVDEPGGISLDRLGEVTRELSRALDDADPISSRYTLEVSSPGVERPLRTARHFQAAVGEKITFKYSDAGRTERLTGMLTAADDDAIDVLVDPSRPDEPATPRRVAYRTFDKARTVFEWGPPPKPGKGSKPGAAKGGAKHRAVKSTPAGEHGAPPGTQITTFGDQA
jgi:ribosome maturation factor RimP